MQNVDRVLSILSIFFAVKFLSGIGFMFQMNHDSVFLWIILSCVIGSPWEPMSYAA